MRKKIIHNFNLIEIALAICVIAIGLTGVMSLFALGAKTNRQSIANNNMSNIAEYMLGSIKSIIQSKATFDNFMPDGSMLSKFDLDYDSDKATTKVDNVTNPEGNWVSLTGEDKSKSFMLRHPTHENVFLFRQMSQTDSSDTPTVDFACIAYIWREKIPFPEIPTELKKEDANGQNTHKDYDQGYLRPQYASAICLELSYPAEFPYERREKQVFRLELFNEKFEPKTATNN